MDQFSNRKYIIGALMIILGVIFGALPGYILGYVIANPIPKEIYELEEIDDMDSDVEPEDVSDDELELSLDDLESLEEPEE
jgi:hypothetical protein